MHGLPQPPAEQRFSRETRLLLITVAVCAVVLLVLARLRFPAAAPVEITAPPLERLAARASYDSLAADIQRVEPLIARQVVVIRTARLADARPRDVQDALRPEQPSSAAGVRHLVALRVDAETAVAAVDADGRVDGTVVPDGRAAAVIAIDPIRRIGRIQVPQAEPRPLPQASLASLPTPLYVVVVEGTQAGLNLRPVFIGRSDRFTSARWARPLLPVGGIAVAPGALIFTLTGEFIGMAVLEEGVTAIVGARELLDAAGRLTDAPPVPSDLGLRVHDMTPELSAATGLRQGVIVAEVAEGGPAAAVLEPGDVILALGGQAVDNPDDFLVRTARLRAGDDVSLTWSRGGDQQQATLTAAAAGADASAPGVTLASERGVGTRVAPGGDPSIPGLQPGDVVTRAGDVSAPTPVQVRQVLATATPSGFTILLVRRDGRQRVVAAPVSGGTDVAGR